MTKKESLEYILSYGWAILIILTLMVTLYAVGIFNPATMVNVNQNFKASSEGLELTQNISGPEEFVRGESERFWNIIESLYIPIVLLILSWAFFGFMCGIKKYYEIKNRGGKHGKTATK